MAIAVGHLCGIVATRTVRPGWHARVEERVRMSTHNNIDNITRLLGNQLVHVVAAMRDHDDNVGALLRQKARLLANRMALVAKDQVAGVGQILEDEQWKRMKS